MMMRGFLPKWAWAVLPLSLAGCCHPLPVVTEAMRCDIRAEVLEAQCAAPGNLEPEATYGDLIGAMSDDRAALRECAVNLDALRMAITDCNANIDEFNRKIGELNRKVGEGQQ